MHAVWRDLNNDLGHDLLLDHYTRQDHRRGSEHLRRRITPSIDLDAEFIAERRRGS